MEGLASAQFHIVLFGELPETADWLCRQQDVVLHPFADSSEMERALDTLEVRCDLVLVRTPGVTDLLPATLSACHCHAFLLDDPPSEAALRRLEDWITAERCCPSEGREPRRDPVGLKLHPDAVYSEEDGIPILTRGEQRRAAENAEQAWLLRLIKDGAQPLENILEQMVYQKVIRMEPDETQPAFLAEDTQLYEITARCVIAKFAMDFCCFLAD